MGRTKLARSVILLALSFGVGCTASQHSSAIERFRGKTVGCGDFIAYRFSKSADEYISVAINVERVDLEESHFFAIERTEDVEVKWERFDGRVSPTICSSRAALKPAKLLSQTAKSGVIRIKVQENALENEENEEPYEVSIVMHELVFDAMRIDYMQLEDVKVGWVPRTNR